MIETGQTKYSIYNWKFALRILISYWLGLKTKQQ